MYGVELKYYNFFLLNSVNPMLSMFPRDLTNDFRAENGVGSGVASEKQTIKTLEEPPEGPVQDVIVRAVGPQTLKIIWKVGQEDRI